MDSDKHCLDVHANAKNENNMSTNPFSVFIYEWKHFVRTPFKMIALALFVAAGVYGLHNGADLFHEKMTEIEKLQKKAADEQEEMLGYYANGETGPAERPWVNVSNPYWAIWYTSIYHFKSPDPAIVYNIGQSEQYGYYKKVTFWSSPYDADLAEEIANPERLQFGRLDFGFVVIYLLPLLLLVFLYNIKGGEQDNGSMALVEIQSRSVKTWLLARVAFYICVTFVSLLLMFFYGGFLTGVFTGASVSSAGIILLLLFYTLFWAAMYFFIINYGQGTTKNTLMMAGVWLLLTFIIPASVYQFVSIKTPANLMTDLIDAKSDDREQLFDQPDDTLRSMLFERFPEIADSPIAKDSTRIRRVLNRSVSSLANELLKESIAQIENENREKNALISFSYWFNPVSFFQDRFNALTATHYQDFQSFRDQLQLLIDKQIGLLVPALWNDVTVDEGIWTGYRSKLQGEM